MWEVLAIDRIEGRPLANIREKDRALDDVIGRGAVTLKDSRDVFQRLGCLRTNTARHQFVFAGYVADLAREKEEISRANRIGEWQGERDRLWRRKEFRRVGDVTWRRPLAADQHPDGREQENDFEVHVSSPFREGSAT